MPSACGHDALFSWVLHEFQCVKAMRVVRIRSGDLNDIAQKVLAKRAAIPMPAQFASLKTPAEKTRFWNVKDHQKDGLPAQECCMYDMLLVKIRGTIGGVAEQSNLT